MAEFLVYENRSPTADHYPFLVDVQSEILARLETRVVVPVIRSADNGGSSIRNLNPSVKINGDDYVALTQQLSAIPRAILGNAVTAVELSRTEILASIDFLVTGI